MAQEMGQIWRRGALLVACTITLALFLPLVGWGSWDQSDPYIHRSDLLSANQTTQLRLDVRRMLHSADVQNVSAEQLAHILGQEESGRWLSKQLPLGVIIAGGQGSGKGTQAELMVQRYGLQHLSTGDLLRAELRDGSELGLKAKGYMDRGALVPDELITSLVKKKLLSGSMQHGWLLDGFPRTQSQAVALRQEKVFAHLFVLLEVPDAVLVERCEGRRMDPVTKETYHLKYKPPPLDVLPRLVQRDDDKRDAILERLRQYHSNVQAVRDSFQPVLFEVDGLVRPAQVFQQIQRQLDYVQAIRVVQALGNVEGVVSLR